MRRATIREYDKLADKLANCIGSMKYRFLNLCVKAEPVSLVSVEVFVEGEFKKIEDCCKVAKDDDYHFKLFPNYEEDLIALKLSVAKAHPEFKQEDKCMSIAVPDAEGKETEYEVKYLLLTMPEVDDDRYDVLTEAVKVIYDECKAKMEYANGKSKKAFAALAPGETKEDLELLDDELDKLNADWNAKRDGLRDAKLAEINDAYNRWLSGIGQQEVANMEKEDARGINPAMSMNMMNRNE